MWVIFSCQPAASLRSQSSDSWAGLSERRFLFSSARRPVALPHAKPDGPPRPLSPGQAVGRKVPDASHSRIFPSLGTDLATKIGAGRDAGVAKRAGVAEGRGNVVSFGGEETALLWRARQEEYEVAAKVEAWGTIHVQTDDASARWRASRGLWGVMVGWAMVCGSCTWGSG
ncbi:hypothetical protein VUR80DRAFT_5597 [Thermomyces stellatus]